MSNVDPSVPIQGKPTTQSVRDNFSTIKTELEAFQSTATVADGAALVAYKHQTAGAFSTGATATTVQKQIDQMPLNAILFAGATADGATDDATAFGAALTQAALTGQPLYLDGDIALASALNVTLSNPIHIISSPRSSITYTGGSQIGALIYINAAGNDVRVDGNGLLMDTNNLSNGALLISNDTDTAADCYVSGINTLDAKLNDDATLPSIAVRVAFGVAIWGKWENANLTNCHATNVTRVAGLTSGACQPFIIANRNSRWAKHITVEGCTVATCTTADTAGTAAAIDCDGFALFQEDDDEGSMVVKNIAGYNCQGRVLKTQPSNTPVIDGVQIYRNIRGIFPTSTEIALQYGSGFVSNIHAIYEGAATFTDVVTLVGAAVGAEETEGFGAVHVDNVTIFNRATGNLDYVLLTDYNLTDTKERMVSLSNVKVVTGAVDYVISSSTFGQSANASLTIDGFIGSIGSAVVYADGAPTKLDGHLSRVYNTGSSVPVIVDKDATSMTNSWGRWHDGGGNKNIAIYDGGNGTTPGVSNNAGRFGRVYDGDTHSVQQGMQNFGTKLFANADEVTYTYGYSQGSGMLILQADWASRPGIYTTINGSTTINTVAAGSSVSVGAGSEPAGSSDIKIWVASNVLHVKNNTGSNRYISVTVFC